MSARPEDPLDSRSDRERTAHPRPLTEQERQALIERARRELPDLDREFEESMRRLRRIAAGR